MKEWIFFIVISITLIEIDSKLNKLLKQNNSKKRIIDGNLLKDYLGKKVSLIVDNEEIFDSYLFCSGSEVTGVIKKYDNKWLLFEYENNNQIVSRYIKIMDITSINEIKDH